jgi:1-acyl-sn-glycerol-3-phosphate acyltransferase
MTVRDNENNMSLPLGPKVPRRGNAFSRWLGRAVLRAMGWRLEGAVPDLPKMVVIGAPHTTNMDGVIAFAVLTALGLRAGTMIKDSAFKGPFGWLLRWLGALPIDRASPKGVVEQTVDAFARQPQFVLLLAPEGTRSAAPEWKRGFWHVARGAGVPVVPVAIHYAAKRVLFGEPLSPGTDYDADLARLLGFFAAASSPCHPERLSRPLSQAQGRDWRPPAGPEA